MTPKKNCNCYWYQIRDFRLEKFCVAIEVGKYRRRRPWTLRELCATGTAQTHEREKRATTHGQQENLPRSADSPAEHLGGRLTSTVKRIAALMNFLAKHLGGRTTSGANREVSLFLKRMATWISCVDGHVVLLVVVLYLWSY